jgi:transposase
MRAILNAIFYVLRGGITWRLIRIRQFKASHHPYMGPTTQPVSPFAETP